MLTKFMLLIHPGKILFVKKKYAKKGYDPVINYKIVMDDPVSGFSAIFAGILVLIFLGCFFTGLLSFFLGILKINLDYKFHLIITGVPVFLLCDFFVWNNDTEIKKEFKKFDKMPKWEKYLWVFITLLSIVTAIFIWWKGMVFWDREVGIFNN